MGSGSSAAKTAPLPSREKKRMSDPDDDGASGRSKRSFWSKLKCW